MIGSYRNRYYALRHGISLANEEGIIISSPENGTQGWGLSAAGIEHCQRVLDPAQLIENHFDAATTITITSDFRRALETAELFCALNRLPPPRLDTRLRERCFGALEHHPQTSYLPIWERDALDSTHREFGCESTDDVAERLRALLAELERDFSDCDLVLVSHGDPLQILETIFHNLPSNRHRSLTHLGNCELRRLTAANA